MAPKSLLIILCTFGANDGLVCWQMRNLGKQVGSSREIDAVFSVTHARARRQSLHRAFRGVVSTLSPFFGPPLFLPNTPGLHLPPLGHPLFLISFSITNQIV
jgi:hypothetical protein